MKLYKPNSICVFIWCCFIISLSSCSSRKVLKESPAIDQKRLFNFEEKANLYKTLLTSNIQYPPEALANGWENIVYVNCIVYEDGTIKDIVAEPKTDFSDEIKRAFNSLPKPTSSTSKGIDSALFVIPVYFTTSEDSKNNNSFVKRNETFQYAGGEEELYKYINSKLKYPFIDRIKNKKGEVTIHFIVYKHGDIKQIRTIESFSSKYANSISKSLEEMPTWIPGCANCYSPDLLVKLKISYDIEWILLYPKPKIKSELDYYLLSKINVDKLPENFFDDIFENKGKVISFPTIYITGNKDSDNAD